MAIRTLLFLCCACAVGCNPAPEALTIPDEQMAQIMADLHIAEAATNGTAGFHKDSLSHIYFRQVLDIHRVTQDSYEKNLRILVQDFTHLRKIQERSRDILQDSL
jgi:hypothetical protein